MDIKFNGKDCKLLTFKSITAILKLRQQEEKSNLLSALNTSVHHEMRSPLETTVNITEKLLTRLEDPEVVEMV